MFDAARAALLVVDSPSSGDFGQKHSGLIGAFGKILVNEGFVDKEVGRLFNRAHELRLVADYKSDSVSIDDAKSCVSNSVFFVSELDKTFFGDKEKESNSPS